MNKKELRRLALVSVLAAFILTGLAVSQTAAPQTTPAQPDPKAVPAPVPAIDGGIGTCSADFIVNDPDGNLSKDELLSHAAPDKKGRERHAQIQKRSDGRRLQSELSLADPF